MVTLDEILRLLGGFWAASGRLLGGFWAASTRLRRGFDAAREPEEQDRLLREAIARADRIVEGVFGRLIEIGQPFAIHLVWLDLLWECCRKGILARTVETGRQSPELLAWAGEFG